jgi:diguanylate cyclase (GGDEF)-like protein/PAS domain S-box-containing protein
VLIAELISWCTERLQHAQQQLSGSEARYRSLIEKVSVVIYSRSLTDPLGWTYASPRIVNLTGRTAEQWLRHGTWSAALHHADRDAVLRSWHACHSARTPWEAEYRVVQPDGTVIWLHDQAEIVYNEAGDPESWQGLLDNVTERRTLQDRIHHQAYHDPLTGLSNRAFFEERMQRVRLDDGVTGLLFIDLDDFKQINDELGHEVGDEYLVLVASRLREVLRDDDVISRIGGDEFTILLERLPDPTEAEHVAERIMDVLRPPVVLNGRVIFPSASVGVATTASGRFDQPAALLRAADMAMYQAKHRGKCAVVVFAGE